MKKPLFAHILILAAFLLNSFGPLPSAQADDFRLPLPGVMVRLSPPLAPPILRGIKVHPDNPFRFDFILDKGDALNGGLEQQQLKIEATKLIKYFLASLTIPDKDLWVNLSPYEKERIIPQSFGLTEMGRDLLAEDYMLKQVTASLIYPEDKVGKKFWKRVYEEAAKKFGTTNIPVNTFNKVWIVPQKAVVYENPGSGTAYVVESKLKVMLEQDYLSLEKHGVITAGEKQAVPKGNINALGSQIVREIVIPELTREVNEDKNFARLRQVYDSLILAAWYKKKIKDSIMEQVYADKNKTKGLSSPDILSGDPAKGDVEAIYQRYLQAFKKGVYNYIKEEAISVPGMPGNEQGIFPRKYFSGGMDLAMNATDLGNTKLEIINSLAPVQSNLLSGDFAMITAQMNSAGQSNMANGAYWIKESPEGKKYAVYINIPPNTQWDNYEFLKGIKFRVYAAPVEKAMHWEDPLELSSDYMGDVELSFNARGRLVKPANIWRLVLKNQSPGWLSGLLNQQLDSLHGQFFTVANPNLKSSLGEALADPEHFVGKVISQKPVWETDVQRNPKQLLSIGPVECFFDWANPNGKYFIDKPEDTRNEIFNRNDVYKMITALLKSEEKVNMVLRKVGSDLKYKDIELVRVKYINQSERIVFKVSFYKNKHDYMFSDQNDSVPAVSIAAKITEKELTNVVVLGNEDRPIAPTYGGRLEGIGLVIKDKRMYFERWIDGPTALLYGRKAGLSSDALKAIAEKWVRVGRILSIGRSNYDYSNFPTDLNPGNLILESDKGWVVIDAFQANGQKSSPSAFLSSLLKYYVFGSGLLSVKSQKEDDIRSILEGIYSGFGASEDTGIDLETKQKQEELAKVLTKRFFETAIAELERWKKGDEVIKEKQLKIMEEIKSFIRDRLDQSVSDQAMTTGDQERAGALKGLLGNLSDVHDATVVVGPYTDKEGPPFNKVDTDIQNAIKKGEFFEVNFENINRAIEGFRDPRVFNLNRAMMALSVLIENSVKKEYPGWRNLHPSMTMVELLKNALFHGNALSMDLPVFIRINKEGMDVVDFGLGDPKNPWPDAVSGPALMAGFGQGIQYVRSFGWDSYFQPLTPLTTSLNDKTLRNNVKSSKEYKAIMQKFIERGQHQIGTVIHIEPIKKIPAKEQKPADQAMTAGEKLNSYMKELVKQDQGRGEYTGVVRNMIYDPDLSSYVPAHEKGRFKDVSAAREFYSRTSAYRVYYAIQWEIASKQSSSLKRRAQQVKDRSEANALNDLAKVMEDKPFVVRNKLNAKWAIIYEISRNNRLDKNQQRNFIESVKSAYRDRAMTVNGGIDLTPAMMGLQTMTGSRNGAGIKFHLDPAMLKQLQNVPGFVPVIINIQPVNDLRKFLGINDAQELIGV